MSPELITAIRERLQNGQSKEEIKTAVLALGHEEVVFEAAYTLALHDMHTSGVGAAVPLPRASELIASGFTFVRSRLDLAALLLIPGSITAITRWVSDTYEAVPWLHMLSLSVALLAMLSYFVCILATLYVVSTKGQVSVREAFVWVSKHIAAFAWMCLLSALVVWGGLVLFVVPGLIVLMMIYFGQYAFVLEHRRGMSALMRSRELMKGRLLSVVYVLGTFWFLLFVPLFLVGMMMGAADVGWGLSEYPYYSLVTDLGLEVLMAGMNILSMYAMFDLYRALQARASEPTVASAKIRYWLLVWFGVAMAIIIGMFVLVRHSADSLYEDIPVISDTGVLQNEIRSTTLRAREYALTHDQSYEGVCDVLLPTITTTEGVTCNDDQASWALSVQKGEGYWCADNKTSLKKVQSSLEERTTCLLLP